MARTFGRWDVDQFLTEIDPQQFDEWWALYTVEPWGDARADYRTALLATAIETLAREKPVWQLTDFLPFVPLSDDDEPDVDKSRQRQQIAQARALAASWTP